MGLLLGWVSRWVSFMPSFLCKGLRGRGLGMKARLHLVSMGDGGEKIMDWCGIDDVLNGD